MEYEEVVKMYYKNIEMLDKFVNDLDNDIKDLDEKRSMLNLEKYLAENVLENLQNKNFYELLGYLKRLNFILESLESEDY
ncbi:MAG: hypothetical protein E6929_11650 [Clostridium sp.]|nr:hypothetical protein [Clostridium sp.]